MHYKILTEASCSHAFISKSSPNLKAEHETDNITFQSDFEVFRFTQDVHVGTRLPSRTVIPACPVVTKGCVFSAVWVQMRTHISESLVQLKDPPCSEEPHPRKLSASKHVRSGAVTLF